MRRFKTGQKVVYAPKNPARNPYIIEPPKGEVVIIKSYCSVYDNNYDIEGYERDKNNVLQSFNDRHFEPLVETRQHITYKLSAPCPPELLNPNQLIELEQPVRP